MVGATPCSRRFEPAGRVSITPMDHDGPGALLDVDGTLIDSNYLHALAWSRAFTELGTWAPSNAIHRLVGMGGDQLVPTLFGHDIPGAADAWRRHYEALLVEVRPFPDADTLLHSLAEAGLAVVLASSAPKEHLAAARELLDCDDVIDAATSSDDVQSSKPEPDIFIAALHAGSVDSRRAIVIGDSVWDVRAARRAGLACVAVETGGFSSHELSEEGALHVYRDVAELAAQLRTSPVAAIVPC
jgi:HAD superfamily hydrolase (TIGR01509 family)